MTARFSRREFDHAAFTFLLDRKGNYVAFFPPGTNPDRMAVMVREALESN
jgi:protein SCO1/2